MWEKKNAVRPLPGETEGKRSLETSKYRLKNYTKRCFTEVVLDDLD
jgi:hypothetical protein